MNYLKSPKFWLAIGAGLLIVPFLDVLIHRNDEIREVADLHWVGSKFCVWTFLVLLVAAAIWKILVPFVIWIIKAVD